MNNHYKPNLEEEYMNDSQLQYFKARLISMQQDYSNTSQMRLIKLSKKESDVNSSSDLTDVDILNEDNHSYMQKEIEDAFERIKDESYGYCEDTGEEIGIKRLMANPIARCSIQAQERHDREKEILYRLQGHG